jgi:hypothetical protein
MMFAVLVGGAVRFRMSAEQRQQMPFRTADLGMNAALVLGLEHLGEIEGKVDRHQRVEREREEAETRGPNPASPISRSHSGAPVGGLAE